MAGDDIQPGPHNPGDHVGFVPPTVTLIVDAVEKITSTKPSKLARTRSDRGDLRRHLYSANVLAACRVAEANPGKTIVTIIALGERHCPPRCSPTCRTEQSDSSQLKYRSPRRHGVGFFVDHGVRPQHQQQQLFHRPRDIRTLFNQARCLRRVRLEVVER